MRNSKSKFCASKTIKIHCIFIHLLNTELVSIKNMTTNHLLLAYYVFCSCTHLVFSFEYTATNKSLRNCPKKCGNMDITYPFGTKGCYLDETFEVTCNMAPPNSANLPWFGFDTNFISVPDHLLRVTEVGSLSLSFNKSSGESSFGHSINASLIIENLMVSSSRNKFVTIGCDFYAYVVNRDTSKLVGGCASLCYRTDVITSVTSSCSDLGCCQTNLPENLNNITLWVETINTMKRSWTDHCGFFGIVDKDYYSFDRNKLTDCNDTYDIPTIMEWVVGNTSCQDARKRKNYACGHNTNCVNNSRGVGGYRCACQNGYKGNPYLLNGCKDIDECNRPEGNRCPPSSSCFNTHGSYYCVPNKKSSSVFPIILGTSLAIAILILAAACFWSHRKYKKIKDRKLKQKCFKRNGGLLFQKQISSCLGTVVPELKLYKIKELEKATDNFNECRVLGKGGLGTVYKGMLSDGSIVAVKIANVINESQVGQFINEVLILSQIKHRHVIKLLGCCLETQVPRLAYEYVCNGTLHHHLHEVSYPKISWENRLRIAAEIAGALAYLHSYALTAIIHRDVKSSNILLDENYRAIVSDFGLSRSVSIDKTHLTTFVGGTFGYLDPEYFRTGQLTDKSDVYAFGVILAELLTGQKPVSSKRDDEGLVLRFQTALKESCLIGILDRLVADEGREEEIFVVAELCKRCLKLNSRRRPCMKDLAAELDRLRRTKEELQNQESFHDEFPSKHEKSHCSDSNDSEAENE